MITTVSASVHPFKADSHGGENSESRGQMLFPPIRFQEPAGKIGGRKNGSFEEKFRRGRVDPSVGLKNEEKRIPFSHFSNTGYIDLAVPDDAHRSSAICGQSAAVARWGRAFFYLSPRWF